MESRVRQQSRRGFFRTTAAGIGCAALGVSGCGHGNEPFPGETGGGRISVPDPIKAFCVDFNWLFEGQEGWPNRFAKPGHWADASPQEHVAWYKALGANVLQTFAVSCNGYAWYKDGFVPPQPGLQHDFLKEVVRLGHREDLMVMAYFCAGANTKWAMDHPELSYGTPSTLHIPFTDEYLDYLGASIKDAVSKTGIDGFMIDWVWNPRDELRSDGWIEAEKKLYTQLTGENFPATGEPADEDKLQYEHQAIDRCWRRVQEAAKTTRPDCVIWLSCNNITDPTVVDSRMLREVDWLMNEAPTEEYFDAGKKMMGADGRLIQCLVGWAEHDARSYLAELKAKKRDLYGFALPGDTSLPLPIEECLSKPIESFTGDDLVSANDRNIAALARFYNDLPLDTVKPAST